MFHRLIPAAAVVVAALGWAAFAQPPAAAPDAKPAGQPPADAKSPTKGAKNEPAMFEIRMIDDTLMKVMLLEPSVAITTKYGKLSIPVEDVRRLDFGFRYPEGMEAKIDKAIADLGSQDFRTREDAEQALAGMNQYAVPALRRAVKSDDPEIVRRSQAVLKLLLGKLTPEQLETRDYDVVETAEFTAKGKIDLASLKVRTKYFGEATVKITDVRTFRSAGSAAHSEFTLDANKFAKMNQADWMETAIEVNAGQQLEVTATGKIDQWPQGPGQYMCEAGGLPGYGGGPGFPGQPVRVGIPGQVIGRIGANGTAFAVGASYKGKVTESGKLYLRIGPSPWNCDSTGSYKLTVNVTTP